MREEVYALCRKIPKGKVTTYKEIAQALNTKAYQAIGQILKNNPQPLLTPCHRVVKSNGEVNGYFGNNQLNKRKKEELLWAEGVEIGQGKVNLKKHLFHL